MSDLEASYQPPQMMAESSDADKLRPHVQQILERVAKDQVVEALELLKQTNEMLAEILLFRWKRIERDEAHSIILPEQAHAERNELVYELLQELRSRSFERWQNTT